MQFFVVGLFYLGLNFVSATLKDESLTDNLSKSSGAEKQSRFIKFKDSGEEVKIELEFTVPFIKIPVERKMDDPTEVFVSPRGLVTAGIALLLFLTVVPKLVQSAFPFIQADTLPEMNHFASRVDAALENKEFSFSQCFKKISCVTTNYIKSESFSKLSESFHGGTNFVQPIISSITGDAKSCHEFNCSLNLQPFLEFMKLVGD